MKPPTTAELLLLVARVLGILFWLLVAAGCLCICVGVVR
jgi:hypothetical protein